MTRPFDSSLLRKAVLAIGLFTTLIGVIRAQTCNPNIPLATPDSDFVDHGDGTVTHKKTGLMWSKCLLGQSGSDCSSGSAGSYTWEDALNEADTAAVAGYDDWRLPNYKELASIVEEACYDPAINLTFFPHDQGSLVWSASPVADYSEGAWILHFNAGDDGWGYRGSSNVRVRLVRGGQ